MRTRSSGTRVVQIAAVIAAIVTGGSLARAGEEDDLQRQIEIQKTGAADLERLDELKAVGDEISLLRSWLEEAWNLRSKHEYDQVREVVDRAREQADLIRAKITVSKLKAQAEKREAAVAQLKAKIARTRKAITEATAKKKQLEGSAQ